MSSKHLGFFRNATTRLEPFFVFSIPTYLCPVLLRHGYSSRKQREQLKEASSKPTSRLQARLFQSDAVSSKYGAHPDFMKTVLQLPQQCPGCGTFSQTVDSQEPGFYTLSRRSVKTYLAPGLDPQTTRRPVENHLVDASLRQAESGLLQHFQVDIPQPVKKRTSPVCDRCHKLLHHQTGTSIYHPSIDSIRDTISESPHKYNHVYHVIDAADFPMSLIPGLHQLLYLTPQRSPNRRARTGKFYHGRRTDVSFIVTRSDLFAPLKTQVDSLMPYLVSILRDALGSFGKNVRLGNVRCVSAKRGWWTKDLKEDIWNRGGGGWMVGKVNVGKSQLFENVFPKGRRRMVHEDHPLLTVPRRGGASSTANSEISVPIQTEHEIERSIRVREIQESNTLHKTSLLPPLQPEMDYPGMPVVSPLPGTTASPIRISFGNGKGELVDLPGLSRGELELYVQKPHRSSLVMQSRITPEQLVLKPGQSLLLGGFIRITPTRMDTIILAYAFTPISPHLTSTDKAISIQTQVVESGVENIANPGIGTIIKSAGKFPLKWDVTKQRSGPVTTSDGFDIKVDRLPYRILSTDILIEGCGWVELVAQVRKRTNESNDSNVDAHWPDVEVFSPKGAFVGSRRPLGAWILGGQKNTATKTKGRPRKSMKGVKKRTKALQRMAES